MEAARSLMTTVEASVASTEETPVPAASEPKLKEAYGMSSVRSGSSWRWMFLAMASASQVLPSWNLMPSLTLKV